MKMKVNLNKNKTRVRHPEKVNNPESFQIKKPDWLKVKAPNSKGYFETKKKLLTHIMYLQFAKRPLALILGLAGQKNMPLL